MATAQDIINSSAGFAGIKRQGQDLPADRNAIALSTLNKMLARWRNNGVDLKLPTLLAADEIIVDEADIEAIELQLAQRLMIRYKRPIPPGAAGAANTAFIELQAKYQTVDEMELDSAMTRKRVFTHQVIN